MNSDKLWTLIDDVVTSAPQTTMNAVIARHQYVRLNKQNDRIENSHSQLARIRDTIHNTKVAGDEMSQTVTQMTLQYRCWTLVAVVVVFAVIQIQVGTPPALLYIAGGCALVPVILASSIRVWNIIFIVMAILCINAILGR